MRADRSTIRRRRRGLTRGDLRALALFVLLLGSLALYLFVTQRGSEAQVLPPSQEPQSAVVALSDTMRRTAPDTLQRSTPTDTTPVTTARYPGPPPRPVSLPKLAPGATVDLNSADSLLLQRIPGIGPAFARRIVKHRERLGGFYCVEQLQEVYGMERSRYDRIAPYFVLQTVPTPLDLSLLPEIRHPYLSYRQIDELTRICHDQPPVTWRKLMQSGLFSRDDSLRLSPYLNLDTQVDDRPTDRP